MHFRQYILQLQRRNRGGFADSTKRTKLKKSCLASWISGTFSKNKIWSGMILCIMGMCQFPCHVLFQDATPIFEKRFRFKIVYIIAINRINCTTAIIDASLTLVAPSGGLHRIIVALFPDALLPCRAFLQ